MIKLQKFKVNSEDEGKRLDVFLSEKSTLSRSFIKKLLDEGKCTFINKTVKGNKTVKSGEEYVLSVPEEENLDITPKDIPLDIIYSDDDVAVINKPQGLTVHSGAGTKGDTLVNALLYHLDKLSGINGVIRPGIVHRIDKNTSGLLVVAKNDKAHLSLSKQLEDKTCNRKYYALLEGRVKDESGIIQTYIGRNPKDRVKMAVVKEGRLAITEYKVVKRYVGYTLCEFSLKTGRTHQIRVHAKYIGHPVVGDPEYGIKENKFKLNGQLLHAYNLEFIHPTTKKKVGFTCPIPKYFEDVLKKLKEE